MTHTMIKTLAVLAAFGSVASLAPTSAEAGGRGKDYFAETYRFNQPMKGVEGQQGNYYCSYRNQPVYKELPNGRRIKVGYELFQHCY
jgi:hypothetical protein